jgi:hypothetical protein
MAYCQVMVEGILAMADAGDQDNEVGTDRDQGWVEQGALLALRVVGG